MVQNSVILGAATGYTPEKVLIFLNSICKVNYTGTVTLLLNSDQFEEYQSFFSNMNYPFKLEFLKTSIGIFSSSKKIHKHLKKLIKYLSSYIVAKEPKLKKDFIDYLAFPHVSRFFEYHEYLKNNQFTHVMLTDTRDVIIQENPFSASVQGLFLGMEDHHTSIGHDSFHIKWISDVYGKQYLESIADQQISCAGVTFGDYGSVMNYLEVMIHEFMSLPYYMMVRSNYDQGIHNKLLYCNAFKHPILCQPLESPILTVGILDNNEIKMDNLGHILNKDGSIPMVVHQYDRHKNLERKLEEIYLN